MISQKEFFNLDQSDQIQMLYTEGTFIVSIRYYEYKVNLYLLANFYVEVFYNHKRDQIERIELLQRKNKRIKFYADQINLPANLLS